MPIPATFIILVAALALCGPAVTAGEQHYSDLDAPEHDYWKRPLQDPFTRIKGDLEAGRLKIKATGEKEFLVELLELLEIPVSSQMLVFSTTSLQLRFISPRSPRAIYFNEEIHVGYVPGGRIEVVSIDPHLGAIFYIFDIPHGAHPLVFERSARCMNCHADEDTRNVPGLVIKSVIPGPQGGSLESYRRRETGHQIPLSDRFGGWHVTGGEGLGPHWGNLMGRFVDQKIVTTPLPPGEKFDWSIFPVATSDILAHLLHEHQTGFVNRAVEAHYRARSSLQDGQGKLDETRRREMEELAASFARYILFRDEAPLPPGGIRGDEAYKNAFLANRLVAKNGDSLKDFDLRTRMFRNPCSYMIYSPVYRNLPAFFREMVRRHIHAALSTGQPGAEHSGFSADQKTRIREILRETHPDFAQP